jgi:hypothetical protein
VQVPRWKVTIRRVDELNVVKSVTMSPDVGEKLPLSDGGENHSIGGFRIRSSGKSSGQQFGANERKRIWLSRDFPS